MNAEKGKKYLGFKLAEIERWRRDVAMKREMVFRRRWQNPRNIPALISLEDERGFEFLLDWYHESAEINERQKNTRYYEKLLRQGLDPRIPRELQPLV